MDSTTPDIARNQIRASKVSGTSVYNVSGEKLGHIDDIILNKHDGKASVAIMSFGGFLGIGEEYHPLPWDSLKYDENQGGYVVNVSREQLEGAPVFAREHEPDWSDPVYGQRLTGYYGMPVV